MFSKHSLQNKKLSLLKMLPSFGHIGTYLYFHLSAMERTKSTKKKLSLSSSPFPFLLPSLQTSRETSGFQQLYSVVVIPIQMWTFWCWNSFEVLVGFLWLFQHGFKLWKRFLASFAKLLQSISVKKKRKNT